MQFVYLPTGDYVSGYIRDLQSVGISVHDYDLWTEETRPIAERTLEHIRQSIDNNLNSYTDDSEYNLTAVGRSWIYRHDGKP